MLVVVGWLVLVEPVDDKISLQSVLTGQPKLLGSEFSIQIWFWLAAAADKKIVMAWADFVRDNDRRKG